MLCIDGMVVIAECDQRFESRIQQILVMDLLQLLAVSNGRMFCERIYSSEVSKQDTAGKASTSIRNS